MKATQRLRIIMENDHFVAFAPYASNTPYEIALLPRRHRHPSPPWNRMNWTIWPACCKICSRACGDCWMIRITTMCIDSAPVHMSQSPFFHWGLLIYPRLTTRAGFEIGSGIGINVVAPEQAAAQLRETDGAPMTFKEEFDSE